jgi:hypothetical protein
MKKYEYTTNLKYDISVLDNDIRLELSFSDSMFDSITSSPIDENTGKIDVCFHKVLNREQEYLLTNLVNKHRSNTALYKLWCGECKKWFEIYSDGKPLYCDFCNVPFVSQYPFCGFKWLSSENKLRNWATVELFISYPAPFAIVPKNGIELDSIVVENTTPPRITEIQRDGFKCAFQVGSNNSVWANTSMQFSWRILP